VISKVVSLKAGAALFVALAAGVIDMLPARAGPNRPAHILVSEVTEPPAAWVQFCTRNPGACIGPMTPSREVALSQKSLTGLGHVNKWVNETIKPLSDLEHWGVAEHWSYPDDGYGDCEDYVLLKRRILIQAGWPSDALLVTVVRDKNGEGHAVLMVITDKGDYVLDNQTNDILLWSRISYRFVKRQSQSDPNVWVALGDSRTTTATATSR
jgi:predicted transglutaminase-like cysteine proteinase